MKTICINDQDISYEETGSGPTLLLLHGFGVGIEIWDHCVEALSKKYTVILLDLPGYGSNKDIVVAPHLKIISSFVRDFIEKIGSVEYIVGYSMSGLISLDIAKNPPASVKKIVFVAMPTFESKNNFAGIVFSLIGKYPTLTSLVCFLVKRFPVKHILFLLGGLSSIKNPQAMNECMRKFGIDSRMPYVFTLAAGLFYPTLLHTSSLPVDFIYGEHDGFAKSSMAKKVMIDFTNSNLHVIKGAYHLIPLEKPQEFSQIVIQNC